MVFEITQEQRQLIQMTRDFAQNEIVPYVNQWEKAEEIPRELFRKFGALGFAGMVVPENDGGIGLDRVSIALIAEEIGKVHRASGFIFLHNMILGLIYKYGTREQVKRWVPGMANGEKLGAIAITEPGAGSDVANIKTRAARKGDKYLINGQKCFITNGGFADVVIVVAKTSPEAGSKGITLFVVERGTPGFTVPKKEKTLGVRATPIFELLFEDCEVSVDNLLGKENEGFSIVMDGLESGRITNAALAVGVAQGAYEIALKYSQERYAFGQPISSFQGIQWMLADMATEIESARLLTLKAAAVKDKGERAGKYCSMAKRFAADTAMKVCTDAVQILGGAGYTEDYLVERFLRDAKAAQIVEGTSQIQRLIISREVLQGR